MTKKFKKLTKKQKRAAFAKMEKAGKLYRRRSKSGKRVPGAYEKMMRGSKYAHKKKHSKKKVKSRKKSKGRKTKKRK